MTMVFEDTTIPDDVGPDLEDVEYPCRVCGREAGPYGGRGPKPKLCSDHKSAPKGKQTPRIGGKDQNLAAQATAVLVNLNSMVAIGVAAVGLFKTGSTIMEANGTFEAAAYQALLTDPEFCKAILKSGAKSAKLSLALAYGGMGMTVAPTAFMELKDRKAERDARKLAEENGQ